MQNLIFSLNATLPVFLVMVVGYALGQLGFLPPAFCKASDRLTFKVTLPLMLFLDMGSVDILHDFRPRFVLFCFAATLVGILTVWAGAKRFLKDKTLVGEFVQAGYRSSAAVLGVAFIQNIYGSAGMAPLMILGSVPLFNIFAVLILMLESPEQRGVPDPKQLLRGVATNPILLGIVFGTVYALLPFTLPQIATKTISSIASLTTPLSLLSIGASFEGTKATKKLGPTLAAAFIKTSLRPDADRLDLCSAERGILITEKGFPIGESGLMRAALPAISRLRKTAQTSPSSDLASLGHLPPMGKAFCFLLLFLRLGYGHAAVLHGRRKDDLRPGAASSCVVPNSTSISIL